MATTLRSRPCVEIDIHDDHSHTPSASGATTAALGELPLNNIHNIKPRVSSIESLARQLDNFHIHCSDKENRSRVVAEPSSPRAPSTAPSTKDVVCGSSEEAQDLENNPLALASQQLPSTKEQLSKHQEGQFKWLLSIPVNPAAARRRPRSDSHGDAELRHGEKTLYFGCNLVRRRSQSGGALDNDRATDVYTLLATRIQGVDEFAMEMDAEIETLQSTPVNGFHKVDMAMAERRYQALDVPKSPALVVEVKEVAADADGERSRPLSRIEDSVEALDKLEEEIEAVTRVAQMGRVLSPEASARNVNMTRATTTPMKRATSVRAAPNSARSKLERTSSVRKTAPANDNEAAGSTTSSARKVPRPTSLLPPKPPAKSSKPPTVSTFELPGEAVARRLKEQREQRRSQQISSEQAAALAAVYSPAKPHFKSPKPPTRPTFELPGEAISRRKREEHEAKLRAQEEEERKRRAFKARPIRASLVPATLPRETLTSLARQKSRATEGSSDSTTTTITPVNKKRASLAATLSAATARPSTTMTMATTTPIASTLPMRGIRGRDLHRNPLTDLDPTIPTSTASRATSTSATSTRSSTSRQTTTASSIPSPTAKKTALTPEQATQQKLRGKEVFARDNAYTAERERERRERENAAKEARQKAAERSRELSRAWAERKRRGREGSVAAGV